MTAPWLIGQHNPGTPKEHAAAFRSSLPYLLSGADPQQRGMGAGAASILAQLLL